MQRAFSSPHSTGARRGAAPVDHGHAPLSKVLLANFEVIEQENKCLLDTNYYGIIAQKLMAKHFAMTKSLVHFTCIILLSQGSSSASEELGKEVIIPGFHAS